MGAVETAAVSWAVSVFVLVKALSGSGVEVVGRS